MAQVHDFCLGQGISISGSQRLFKFRYIVLVIHEFAERRLGASSRVVLEISFQRHQER